MSLSEERLLILKMLEEGKITSEEASKLFDALDSGSKQSSNEGSGSRQQKQANFQEEIFKVREKVSDWKRDFKNNYGQKDFDRAVDEFSNKAEKLGKNLAVTTFGIVDKMIDFVGSFVDTNSFNIFGTYKAVERSFETAAIEGMDLNIEGTNGYIVVKKHLENNIIIKSRIRSPLENVDNLLSYVESERSINVKLKKEMNLSVSHEIFLPVLMFKNVKLETTNGKIYVEDTMCENFESNTKNSHIELMGVNSQRIRVSTKNAKIQISYVICKEIDINTNNSVIDIKHIKAEKIEAVTKNGRILVENANLSDNAAELKMNLKTSNGGIKVNMNDIEEKGYKIRAQTTNGGVNLLVPNVQYNRLDKQGYSGNFIEAESKGYEGCSEKVIIEAETVNGYIEIVK